MTYAELMEILDERGIDFKDFRKRTGLKSQMFTNAKSKGSNFSEATMKVINKELGIRTVCFTNPHQDMGSFNNSINEMIDYIAHIDNGSEILIEMRKNMSDDFKKRMMDVIKAMFPEEYESAIKIINEGGSCEI